MTQVYFTRKEYLRGVPCVQRELVTTVHNIAFIKDLNSGPSLQETKQKQ